MIDQSLIADRYTAPRTDLAQPIRAAGPLAAVAPPTALLGAQETGLTGRRALASVERIVTTLRVSDALAVGLAAGGAALVSGSFHGLSTPVSLSTVLVAMAAAALVWIFALTLARAYEPRYLFSGSAEIHRVGIAGAAVALVATSAGWMVLDRGDAPVVMLGIVATLLVTLAGRWVIRMRVQRANRTGVARTRVIAVGDSHELPGLVGRLHRNRYHGWDVVALHALDVAGRPDETADSSVADIVAAAGHHNADLVLLATSGGARLHSVAELQRALHNDGRDFALAPPLVEAVGPRVSVDSVCGLPVVRIAAPELFGPRRVLKDIADRAVAGTAILFTLPVTLLMALAIRLDSRGPAIFRQTRVGRDGRLFTIWKFRTMYTDAAERQAAVDAANEGAGPLFKMKRDPRVTRLGRVLRRTSLDELPQLWNILAGHMSVVGPRPALPREVAEYDDVTRRRLLVPPGLTGLWQIHGRSDLTWDETRRLDVRYVENWSLGFDLSILLRTIDAVLRGRGAY